MDLADEQPAANVVALPLILIVDDEPSIREFLAFVLEDEGFAVISAADGIEALKAIEGHHTDVVLTDLMMPRMDGFELIRRLREKNYQIRAVIAMSAISTAGERASQADLFLQKPFEVEQVLASVHSFMDAAADSGEEQPT